MDGTIYIVGIFGVVVIFLVGLMSLYIFKAFKSSVVMLDTIIEKYVPKKDCITIEISREWLKDFAEEFGYIVTDYDKLMRLIDKNLWNKKYHNGNTCIEDVMIILFSMAVEEKVVYNTLENTFANMMLNRENDEKELPETDTVIEEVPIVKETTGDVGRIDPLTQNRKRAEKDGLDKKFLLRRGN